VAKVVIATDINQLLWCFKSTTN